MFTFNLAWVGFILLLYFLNLHSTLLVLEFIDQVDRLDAKNLWILMFFDNRPNLVILYLYHIEPYFWLLASKCLQKRWINWNVIILGHFCRFLLIFRLELNVDIFRWNFIEFELEERFGEGARGVEANIGGFMVEVVFESTEVLFIHCSMITF